mgnify:CR=1 FL=1
MTDEEFLEHLEASLPDKCRECGSKIRYIGGGQYRCIKCGRTYLDDYGKVREYLYAHGRASTADIEEATGVKNEFIVECLKEGRFEMVSKSAFVLNCERCGRPINTGKLCKSCEQFNDEVEKFKQKESGAGENERPKIKGALVRNTQSGRMRYYNRDKE